MTSSLLSVVLLEWMAAWLGQKVALPRLGLIGLVRTTQLAVVLLLAAYQTKALSAIGLSRKGLLPGMRTGLRWSAGFAGAAGLLFSILWLTGHDPLSIVRSPLPTGSAARAAYFFIGGIVAPVAEEVVFRGIIFGYLRRWGVPSAVILSTVLFAALHMGSTVPLTQIVGGVVFALAYQVGKSLMTPIVVHSLGNLSIFSLSML